jgi:DNA-binding NarL/FixJ family response regulator
MTVIRVLLADDNDFVRQALADLLTASGDLEVVAQCADGDEVVAAAQRVVPDVVLLDLAMARVGGMEAARRLLAVQPATRVVVLTASGSTSAVYEARDVGAVGYLLKAEDPEQLLTALRTVAAGGTAWWAGSDIAGVTPPLPDRPLVVTASDDITG